MANNVTFIIGNGLDLSLNLKTSYNDFYNHVKKAKLHPNNKIYEAINKDHETWSNFELTLGTYTRYIEDIPEKDRKKASLAFHEDLEEVTQDLADYLEAQEKKLDVSVSFERDGFFEELPIGMKDRIVPLVARGPVTFSFITLNYTNTLENILPNRNIWIVPSNFKINTIHHVHGILSDDVTLGVNDESQLSSALTGDERDDLIKPRLIRSMNDGRIDTLERIIHQSSIVVLFGTSMGETDKYIWDYLVGWLAGDSSRHIIIHKHDSNYTESTRRIPRRKKLFMSEVQDMLLRNSELDDAKKTELRARIFVVHNTKKLFLAKQKTAVRPSLKLN